MELSNKEKRDIHLSLITQLEHEKYMSLSMGKTWQEIGNAAKAEQSAKDANNSELALVSQRKQLEAISE